MAGGGGAPSAASKGGGGAYARLFSMKHPGSHRRVGVDPLDNFKKEHYRIGAEKGGGRGAGGGGGGGGAVVIAGAGGESASNGGGEAGDRVFKPAKVGGEVRRMQNRFMSGICFVVADVN